MAQEMLASKHKIKTLDLSFNEFSDAFLVQLADAFDHQAARLVDGRADQGNAKRRARVRRSAADEVGDAYAQQVVVEVNGQVRYQGSTAEIDHKAEDVFAWLGFISAIQPGSPHKSA